MGIFSKIFKGKESASEKGWRVGGMEDFMTLIRVYYQAVMAANLGISNIAALPDLRVFKQTLHVPTLNNKLGLGEKNKCKKMLQEIYGISDDFFKEIDKSIKVNCRNINDVRSYFFMFQGFSQDLMMLITASPSFPDLTLRIAASSYSTSSRRETSSSTHTSISTATLFAGDVRRR